jgi:hypothetical protein
MRNLAAAIVIVLMASHSARAQQPSQPTFVREVRAPQGEIVRLPVTRDTWFSHVGNEINCNMGGAPRLKMKSNQEMALIDIDPALLKGRVINGATLFLRSSGEPILCRVTVGTFGADWVEGTSPSYAVQKGSSSFAARKTPDVPWTVPGSDLCAVILGQGGTLWRMADAFPPDEKGWQKIAVDPTVVAARSAGISYGFLLFDDTGTEWTRQGEKFTLHHMPNRFAYSREQSGSAPYLVVYLGEKDTEPPAKPTDIQSDTADLPVGEAWVSWITPADAGPAGTIGFFVTVGGKEVPRYLIPLAGKPGERVRMRLRDLDLQGGAKVELAIKAVDGAGNVGQAATATVSVSNHAVPQLPGAKQKPFADTAALPRLAGADIAIIDELDKVHPISGARIPNQPDEYLAANHLWSAKQKEIQLHAARNEFTAFQILLRGPVEGVKAELTFPDAAKGVQASFGRYVHVNTPKGPLPDPVLPLRGAFAVPTPEEKIDGQKSGSLHCEVYVPHDGPAGEHRGKLTLQAGDQKLEMAVRLRVWDFTLPDYLSFLPEMNTYGSLDNERAYYRLAHRHRTVLNKVPYSQSGNVHDGCAPKWDGKQFDWAAWDKRFGPLFDGSAFADLPRKGVPLEVFYLPLHENWPSPIKDNYNGDYWADRAFPARYRAAFVLASRQFAEHCSASGWHDTLFHCFFNGKNNFKQNGWSRGSSPWLLDEPANFQDYWALRYFGVAFHEGVRQANGKAKMLFRADISRPQWQRTALDGLLDYNVVSAGFRAYPRIVLDRKEANGDVLIEYGGANALTESNMQTVGWSIDAWSLGTDGVLPWQTIGRDKSWQEADTLSLFYPGKPAGEMGPVPSVRLKAYRRGQQDVEYLTLLALQLKQPRWAIGQRVREALKLAGVRKGTGFVGGEDAGIVSFAQLRPQDVWALRVQIGNALSEMKPEPKRKLVDLRTPPRDLSRLAPGYVSVGEVPPAKAP